ncbi:MAG TPA: hypothetical protein VFE78_25655 [Gemmataceae bacterium]|nr:hypothetical protein [Gemmataceae bacterium]
MAGRALAFSDAEILRMAREDYVPVACDDWYQRRREDDEGRFFRSVADQGPMRGAGGSTRQGIYCLTASGKLLAYKNAQGADVMREVLRQGLAKWRQLPASERRPGAYKYPSLAKPDERYVRTPPSGGLIVNVSTRILDHDEKDGLCRATCTFTGGDQAARDHLWLTKADWQTLVRGAPRKGSRFPMPRPLADRLLRFHLVDITRGEPDSWRPEDVRKADLTWTAEEATPTSLLLRLDGSALLATDADPDRAGRGYDMRLLGYLHYDRAKGIVDRFDLLAVGDHWGASTFTPGARPGRKPLGVAFELRRGNDPADLLPPQGARWLPGYLGARP